MEAQRSESARSGHRCGSPASGPIRWTSDCIAVKRGDATRRIAFLRRSAGGERCSADQAGKCIKVEGLARAAFDVMMDDASAVERPVDFAIWLSASTLKGAETDEIERELFHQLLHIGQDDNQRWELAQHEVEAFCGELETYGLPERLQQVVGTQMPLTNGRST